MSELLGRSVSGEASDSSTADSLFAHFIADVLRRHGLRLRRMAARYVGPDAAEDVVQDALAAIWNARQDAATMVVVALVIGSLVIVSVASAQAGAPPQGVLDGIRDAYRVASSGWRARLLPIAQSTFLILAGLEFAVSGMVWSLRRDSLDEIAAKFLLKFTLIAFLLAVLTAFTAWLPPIMNGFAVAGERAIGRGLVSPSTIVDIGRETGAKVLEQLNFGVMLKDPVMAMIAALAAMVIALSYVWIATQLVLVMVESYIAVLGGGVLFFGFASSRWTASFAGNVVGYAFYVGAKMFLLYLIVGVGADVARSWIPLIQGSDFFGPASPMMEVLGGAVMFAVVATVVPARVAARLTHNQNFGIAHALRALS